MDEHGTKARIVIQTVVEPIAFFTENSMNIVEGLIEHQMNFVKFVHEVVPNIVTESAKPALDANSFAHSNYQLPASSFALLYVLDHPKNTIRGQAWLRDDALALTDILLSKLVKDNEGQWVLTEMDSEWLPFVVMRVITLLKDEISSEMSLKAKIYVEKYVEQALRTPVFFTSPNHESWRCLYLYLAGDTYGREEWKKVAVSLMHQLLQFKTKEGFWEESTHHGPSLKYNQLMLSPLAWLARWTGDQEIREGAKDLAGFMAKWIFPDGVTVGSFDGRQSSSLMMYAPVVPGLEFHKQGATLNQRGIDLWEKHGNLSTPEYLGTSNWYAFFSSFSIADGLMYFSQYENGEYGFEELEIDKPDAKLINHSTEFNGMLVRKSDWVLGTSSQNADIPRSSPSLFRLERQSRFDLWHKKHGVIIGGGHNISGSNTPLANVIYALNDDVMSDFGYVEPSRARGGRLSKALYMARAISSDCQKDVSELKLFFGNGTFHWKNRAIDDNVFEFSVTWKQFNIKKMYLQLPLLLWRKQTLIVNEREVDGNVLGLTDVAKSISIADKDGKSIFSVECENKGETKIRTGIGQLRIYGPLMKSEFFEPPYTINMISTLFSNVEETGSYKWLIRVN